MSSLVLCAIILSLEPQGGQDVQVSGTSTQVSAVTPSVTYETQQDPVYLIGKEIRCPVCQGMPIADSPSEMAQSMMKKVREMVAQGKSKDEIFDTFSASYGEWVILRPRHWGLNALVWFLPPISFVFALWIVRGAIRKTQNPKAGVSHRDESLVDGADLKEDAYLRAVRQEVEG
jgi:cytochrome c-type biogenesis protein CcmH